MSLRNLLSLTIPFEQLAELNPSFSEEVIRRGDSIENLREKIPLTIILDDIRASHNCGAILRTAECVGAEQVLFCGFSPSPENPKTQKTSMGTEDHIAWKSLPSLEEALRPLKEKNYQITFLETSPKATSLFEYRFEKPAAVVVGNEQFGFEPSVLRLADEVVEIPIFGQKNSLNVSTALGVCAYEVRRQWG
jgi:tRNA G18 (ribose-2'-O)-methylase SpoU